MAFDDLEGAEAAGWSPDADDANYSVVIALLKRLGAALDESERRRDLLEEVINTVEFHQNSYLLDRVMKAVEVK